MFVLAFDNAYWNENPQMIFPVISNNSISFERSQNNETFNSMNGELTTVGMLNLATFSVESIFPNKDYPWIETGATSDGWYYVRTIEEVRTRRIPFRAVYLDRNKNEIFNVAAVVDSFSYSVDAAGDINYSLSFKEYRFAESRTAESLNTSENLANAEKTAGFAVSSSSVESQSLSGDVDAAGTTPATRFYTDSEAVMLSKTLYGEANGLPTIEVACVGWCICNRADSSAFPNTIAAVITQKKQFDGYKSSHPSDKYLSLAKDILNRWSREKSGESSVYRVMPKGYLYFNGYSGHNWHTKKWHNSPSGYYNDPDKWGYTLTNPYR